jgi:hypothetical protein
MAPDQILVGDAITLDFKKRRIRRFSEDGLGNKGISRLIFLLNSFRESLL